MSALTRLRDWLGITSPTGTYVSPPTIGPEDDAGDSGATRRALPALGYTGGPRKALTLRDNEIFWLRGTVQQIHGYALTVGATATTDEERRIARTLLAITGPTLEDH